VVQGLGGSLNVTSTSAGAEFVVRVPRRQPQRVAFATIDR